MTYDISKAAKTINVFFDLNILIINVITNTKK